MLFLVPEHNFHYPHTKKEGTMKEMKNNFAELSTKNNIFQHDTEVQ